jgi:hypothetical protein
MHFNTARVAGVASAEALARRELEFLEMGSDKRYNFTAFFLCYA